MTEEMIHELAVKLFSEGILLNWQFYVFQALLLLIFTALSSFLGAYLQKRGANYATKQDFQNLLDQQEKLTQKTEQIRSDISNNDWAAREWKTVRRIKLEELLSHIYEAKDWLNSKELEAISDVTYFSINNSPIKMVIIRSELYFPELKPEVSRLETKYTAYLGVILKIRSEFVGGSSADRVVIYRNESSNILECYSELSSAIQEITNKAADLMPQLFSV